MYVSVCRATIYKVLFLLLLIAMALCVPDLDMRSVSGDLETLGDTFHVQVVSVKTDICIYI